MLYICVLREALLSLLPAALDMAEIGVQRGVFSQALLATGPRVLHLIDPWEAQADAAYARDPANADVSVQLANYEAVRAAVGGDPRVRLHRGYSENVLPTLDDASLDLIYVDGNHTHDAVLSDLRAAARLIRPGGMIWGHDFCSHWRARDAGFGVIGAVMEFCKTGDWRLFGLTGAPALVDHPASFATYLLATDPATGLAASLLRGLVDSPHGFMDLPDAIAGMFAHDVVVCADGGRRYIPRFTASPLPGLPQHRGW